VRDRAAVSNLLRIVYQTNRELSHLVVLPKSASEFVADALNCPHFDSRVTVTKIYVCLNSRRLLVCLNHVASAIANADHSIMSGSLHIR
jgi:hypothetical protein